MAEENLVPDDELKSAIPDAVVTLEEPKTGVEEKKPDAALPEKDAAEEGVEAMAKSLETEKKRREEAERQVTTESTARVEAERKAADAESRIGSEVQRNIAANRSAATEAKAAGEAEYQRYKKQAAELQAEGKFEEAEEARANAFEARQKIKGADGYLSQLDNAVARLEEEAKNPKPVTVKPQDDPAVDKHTGVKYTPKTSAWIEKHKDGWADEGFRSECFAANIAAKKKDIQPDTPEYFEFIEQRLQREGYLEMPAEVTEPKPDPKPAPKKPSGASVSAAPTRAVPGTASVPKNGVKLSGIEREIARSFAESLPDVYGKDVNPDQLWAKNKAAIEQEGND